jgi:mRNA interferase MazF
MDLNPIRGHEQAGRRPVLVVSEDLFNRGPAGLVIVLPMTSTLRNVPSHVPIDPPEGGVKRRTAVLCEAVRSVSVERLIARWGPVSRQTMAAIEDRLRILLRL